jgi:cytochrome bd ubiquinol oxidase subunit II
MLAYLIFALIALAVLIYVLMDGWDLGVGILFLAAPRDKERDQMMESIAPFWDGNETWLVFGGVTLFGAFSHRLRIGPASFISACDGDAVWSGV